MNCPRCGADQPYDVKCVKCDTDIAAFLKSEKKRLWFYQTAAVLFFAMTLWLGIGDFFIGKPRSFQTAQQSGEESTVTNPGASPSIRILPPPTSRDGATGGPVTVVLNKSQISAYETFVAFKSQYRDPLTVLGTDQDLPLEADLGGATLVAIGSDAVTAVSAKHYDTPQIYLSRQANLGSLLKPDDKIVGVQTTFSPDLELIVLHQLFPDARNFIFVAPEQSKRPTFALLKDLDLRLTSALPDAVNVEREVGAAPEMETLVWLHGLASEEREAALNARGLDKALVVVGLGRSTSSSESKAASSPVLVEFGLSNEGLGRQGVSLLKRLSFQTEIPETDLYPKAALEVRFHLARALALEREELLQTVHERARRAGFQVRLSP